MASRTVEELSKHLMLGSLLDELRARWATYELVDHWKQGEFQAKWPG